MTRPIVVTIFIVLLSSCGHRTTEVMHSAQGGKKYGGRYTLNEIRGNPSSLDPVQFDAVLKRNLYGTVNTCLAAAPTMKEQRSGKIITVSSRAGLIPMEKGGYAHYGAAKAGIIMYTRYLAQASGYPAHTLGARPGSFTGWFNAQPWGGTAVTFELAASATPTQLSRVARALLQLAVWRTR